MREITKSHILEHLKVENPWWRSGELPQPFRDWAARPYLERFAPLVEDRSVNRAVVLMGPRRVGKTVLLHHTIRRLLEKSIPVTSILYVSVDHPVYSKLGLEQLVEFHRKAAGVTGRESDCCFFFDEIQYLDDWERHLKAIVDRYPRFKCVASGSAASALRRKSLESGAGRFTDFFLPPLTFYENLHLSGETAIIERLEGEATVASGPHEKTLERLNRLFLHYLNFGGYPEVIFSEGIQSDPGRYIRGDIVDKVLLRDLPGLYGTLDTRELNYLFTTLAFNTGNEVSIEGLAQSSGVAKNTLRRYLEYLEAAFLIRTLRRVDLNARRFKRVNTFRVYLTNPSIRAALFAPVADGDDALGPLVETALLAQEFPVAEDLYYARWAGGEVDMVQLDPLQKPVLALEVKWSDRVCDHPEEIKGLIRFCRENGLNRATATTHSRYATREIDGVTVNFMPAARLTLMLGDRALHA